MQIPEVGANSACERRKRPPKNMYKWHRNAHNYKLSTDLTSKERRNLYLQTNRSGVSVAQVNHNAATGTNCNCNLQRDLQPRLVCAPTVRASYDRKWRRFKAASQRQLFYKLNIMRHFAPHWAPAVLHCHCARCKSSQNYAGRATHNSGRFSNRRGNDKSLLRHKTSLTATRILTHSREWRHASQPLQARAVCGGE